MMNMRITFLMALVLATGLLVAGCSKQDDHGKRKVERSTREVDGMRVSLVQVSGTFMAPGGPMMQSTGKKENYRLLGAIVEGPQGAVFFKLTGPAKTIEATSPDFDALISSIKKSQEGDAGPNVAGVHWVVPSAWGEHPPRQMRVATYMIPAAGDDAEGGECGVFYFGNDQGGSVDANIDRWVDQFEGDTPQAG